MSCIQTRGLAYGQIRYDDLSIEGGKATFISGFSGSGNSNTFQAGLYANYSEGKVYADAVAGYAYSANQIDMGVVLERFWAINEIRYFTWAGLFWLTLAQVWPLKRIIQGIWALFAGCVPTGPGGGVKCLALVVALAVQGGILAFILGT